MPQKQIPEFFSLKSRLAPFRLPGLRHVAPAGPQPGLHLERLPSRAIKLCTVIPVCNEAETLPQVISELSLLPFQSEIICVINGCHDTSKAIAKASGARILEFPEALGHDIGRSLGAVEMDGYDVYLFTDADLVVKATDLTVFVQAVYSGIDVALNDFTRFLGTNALFHPVNLSKYFLNLALCQGHLGPSSLTAIPHALSRNALRTIGSAALSCPPLALTKAALAGLNIQAVHFVDVSAVNKNRPPSQDQASCGSDLVIGDHLEALAYLETQLGKRGWFPDNLRHRELLKHNEVIENVNCRTIANRHYQAE